MENDELTNKENENPGSENLVNNLDSEKTEGNLNSETDDIIESSFVEEAQNPETGSEENLSGSTPIEQDLEEGEKEKETKTSGNWLRKSLLFLLIAILLVLAGYLLSYFTVTIPNQTAFQSVMSDLTGTKADLENLQSEFDQMSVDLQEAQNKYALVQGENVTLQHDYNDLLAGTEYNLNLVNMKYEIGLARFALQDKDLISARQALSLAGDYFDGIRNDLDEEIADGIGDRLENIQSSLTSTSTKAANELRTLAENLERIPLK